MESNPYIQDTRTSSAAEPPRTTRRGHTDSEPAPSPSGTFKACSIAVLSPRRPLNRRTGPPSRTVTSPEITDPSTTTSTRRRTVRASISRTVVAARGHGVRDGPETSCPKVAPTASALDDDQAGQVPAGRHAELAVGVRQVDLDGLGRDEQLLGDRL